MNNTNRLSDSPKNHKYIEVDIVKGIGIILMVWGHCYGPFQGYIYLFHMAIFFMASGFCWNNQNVMSPERKKQFIWKRVKRLYFPFILFNIILILLANLFVKLYLYPIDAKMSLIDMGKEIIKTLFFGGGNYFGGATWFLKALFFVSIEFFLTMLLLKRTKRIGKVIFIIIIVANVVLAEFFEHFSVDLLSYFAPLPASYLAFLLGVLERKIFEKVLHSLKLWVIIAIFAFCFSSLILLDHLGGVAIGLGHITNTPFFIAASLLGWHMLYSLSVVISKLKLNISSVFSYIHFASFKIVTLIYILCSNQDIELLRDFPVVDGVKYLWPFYIIVGVAVPLLFEYFWRRIKPKIIKPKTYVNG